MLAVAVNITLVPEHILLADKTIVMVGATFAFTVMVMPLLVAVEVFKQVPLEVSIQVTTSLLFNMDVVNIGLFDPVFIPFTIHW